MYPNKNRHPGITSPQPVFSTASGIASMRQYTPPVHRENKAGSYIEFFAFDPEKCCLRRKTIKINRIKGVCKRRQYAKEVIARLNDRLKHGWNPWIAKDTSNLITFSECIDRYEAHLEKMMCDSLYRKETYAGYKSYTKMLRHYVATKKNIYYIYQFDRVFCVDFLDWVFIDRNNCAQTRNNYLGYLRVLSGFLVEKGYLSTRPTEGILPISKRLFKKGRTVIPHDAVGRLASYCRVHEKHYLLGCYLLYYCFIRPVEMTRLRIRDFNVKASTITVPAECSKNKTEQTVTVPKKVLFYAIDLGIFSAPATDFIFSKDFRPGPDEVSPKQFRDKWNSLRKRLRLKPEWKFYSLKDTGITEMCDNHLAAIAVRDQARHSSLAVTDIYTRRSNRANPDIIELDGSL